MLVPSDTTINFYSNHARDFASKYESLCFDDLHGWWLPFLPDKGRALDVGAGSGRDAAALASKGFEVWAVEPALGLQELAQRLHPEPNIHWVEDCLPELAKIFQMGLKFELVLVNAVWMHLNSESRMKAFSRLASLVASDGRLVISLRHGKPPIGRTMYPVSSDELMQQSENHKLRVLSRQIGTPDKLGQDNVHWDSLVFGTFASKGAPEELQNRIPMFV